MGDLETLGILEEIDFLISDQLQVVSYKWLSRNYSVSSDAAKKLLREFVEKHESGSGLEVLYIMSGWLKNDSSAYHISLVPGTKLSDAKQEFDGKCSVQVYSVQACIPKDSASLWNAEFVQAEELFKQPSDVDNCLRDNRFCGIYNSFVKRTAERTSPSKKVPLTLGSAKSNSPQLQQRKVQESSPKVGLNAATSIKKESNTTEVIDHDIKPPTSKEKFPVGPTNKKKGSADKSSTGAGSSLTNLWGRACASSKTKATSPPAETIKIISDPIVSAEAQICAQEVEKGGISDDDGEDVNFKRVSANEGSRKRRAVFYYSDEDDDITEDVISLASPDLPKDRPSVDVKHSTKNLAATVLDSNSDLKQIDDRPKVQEEKKTENVFKSSAMEKLPDKIQPPGPVNDVEKKGKMTINAAPNSPKRRKVLKTRIDDRGKEVTEVVWEGEEMETKKAETNTIKNSDANLTKKADNSAVTNAFNRGPATKKSSAVESNVPSNTGSKAGSKKAGNSKDPKQGNIMSFFKRV